MIMRNFSVVWAISGVSKDQVIKYGSTKQRIPLAQIASWEPVAGRAQTNPNDQIQNDSFGLDFTVTLLRIETTLLP